MTGCIITTGTVPFFTRSKATYVQNPHEPYQSIASSHLATTLRTITLEAAQLLNHYTRDIAQRLKGDGLPAAELIVPTYCGG